MTTQNYERIIEHEIFIFPLMSSGPAGPLTLALCLCVFCCVCVCVCLVVGGGGG